jgi:hypothetical protein
MIAQLMESGSAHPVGIKVIREVLSSPVVSKKIAKVKIDHSFLVLLHSHTLLATQS